jgi:hypothetical protein
MATVVTALLECWACSTTFEKPLAPGQPARYCGPACREAAHKARRRARADANRESKRAEVAAWRARYSRYLGNDAA